MSEPSPATDSSPAPVDGVGDQPSGPARTPGTRRVQWATAVDEDEDEDEDSDHHELDEAGLDVCTRFCSLYF
jgi:hypothetical protein